MYVDEELKIHKRRPTQLESLVRRTNTLKAAGALAAGLALLAPIGATHAGWRDSAALGASPDAATIHLGHLYLDSSIQWSRDGELLDDDAVNERGEVNTTVGAGQTLRGVRTVEANLLGDDLTANFTVQCSNLPAIPKMLNHETNGSKARLVISLDDKEICWVEGGGTPHIESPAIPVLDEDERFKIVIELSIPEGVILPSVEGDTVGVGEEYRINLGNMSVVLAQVTPDAEPVAPASAGD